MKSLSDKIIQFRWPIIIGFLLITVFFARQLPKSELEPDMKASLPADMQSRLDTDKIDVLFGGTEMLMILIETDDVLKPETLMRIKKMARQTNRTQGVDKVLSLFDLKSIRGKDGAMIVDPAVRRIPRNETQIETLRETLKENDLVYGSVVSEDFTVTVIIALLKTDASDSEMVPRIQKVIENNPGEEIAILGGLPYLRTVMADYIQGDMKRLMPAGILIMLVFLFLCFRRIRGVMLPFFVVIMSIIVSMGLIPLLGWKIHTISVILPVLLIAVANDYGIHMIAKYQEDNLPENNFTKKELARRMFQHLGTPILMTGLTTMAGMLCLTGHIMVPAKQMGILAAIGIVYALAASLLFIPAVISFLPRSKPVLAHTTDDQKKKPLLEQLLHFFGDLVLAHPIKIIWTVVILALLSAAGIFFVQVDTNPNSYFPDDHILVQTNNKIDAHLGGSQNISVVYKGDIKNPDIMHKIEQMEDTLNAMDEVGNTASIARVIKQMSRALNDKDEPMYNKVPDSRNAIAQYFELYAMSGDAEDFEKMVDFPYEHALVTARVNKTSTVTLKKVVHRIQAITKEDPDVLLTGGFGVVLSDLADAVVNGQLISLFMATLIVGILLMILFRSWTAGILSAIPLALSIIILFGLMGIFGIELNIATALLSSIMIGVGIDYTVHFLWRYKEERRNGLNYQQAVETTLTTTGRGITFNAFSVIVGFSVLMLSNLMPVKFFGFLVVVSILSCLIGALVLIPALCLMLKPRFLEP